MNSIEVNNLIINIQPYVSQVNFGSFHMDLPPTLSMKSLITITIAGPGGGGANARRPMTTSRAGKRKERETKRLIYR
jgi:hypothetical protein